ncbi:MAG: hypothetical protein L6R37_005342 [Teloschistes peruensis]|nr:MAG: hypothetical protein L6R37_005342 [Teloschistes peruensis]
MNDECIGLKIAVGILVTVLVIILFAAAIWIWKDHKRNGQGDRRDDDYTGVELETLRKEMQDIQQSLRESPASANPARDRRMPDEYCYATTSDTSSGRRGSNGKQEEEETTYVPESHHVLNPIHVDETAYHLRWYGDTGGRVGEAQDAFQPAPTLHPRLTPSSEYSQPSRISAVPPSATDYNYNAAEAFASTTGNGSLLR